MKRIKILIVLALLLLNGIASRAQQSFSSKKEALEFLKKSFSKNFIKTPVIINSNKKEISYDYKINEDHLLIIEKTGSDKIDTWVTVPYEQMSQIYSLEKNDYFKKITGIGFKAAFGDSYGVSYGKEYKKYDVGNEYTLKTTFPFDVKKDDYNSIIIALNVISREIKAAAQAAKKIGDDIKLKADVKEFSQTAIDLKMSGTFLKNYSLYNSENIAVNMHEFIEKYRRFKDKPTLVVTWSHTFCPPCLKRIDEILNKGIAANYNIVIVNKDGKTDYSDIKSKMSIRKTDYFTNDILFLIDRDNQLEPLDKMSAPMFIWLDKNMAIKGIYLSYEITPAAISCMLESVSK